MKADAELLAASDVIDAMITGFANGERVEPFQFSAEIQSEANAIRSIERLDQWIEQLDDDEEQEDW